MDTFRGELARQGLSNIHDRLLTFVTIRLLDYFKPEVEVKTKLFDQIISIATYF